VRVPSGEPELVRAAAAGDPAAVAALWDAYGARVFAFCQRVLGRADAAADAAQDAFLLAHAQLGRLERSGESFGVAVFRAARTTSYELLARDARGPDGRRRAPSSLSAAAGRLRPQQRAALALIALEGLRYDEIATVLGVGAETVGALLARARLRLYDELHGTALAASAVRSPDCEDVLALLAATSDGELGAADAGWADPHVTRCPTCPRTRRAMEETAATYAAWSPAVAPAWLREATLAELAEAPAAVALAAPPASGPRGGANRRVAGAWTTPRPRLSAALLGATLLAVAFAALLLSATGSLRQRDPAAGGVRLPDGARSLRVAGVPAPPAARAAGRRRAPRHWRHARPTRRSRRVAFVAVRAVHRVTSAPRPVGTRRPAGARPRRTAPRPTRTPKRRPAPATPVAPAPAPVAPVPASADAPADELPGGADGSTTAAVPASAAQVPPTVTPAKTTTTAPPAPAPTAVPAAAPLAVSARGQDHDRGGGRHKQPCPPAPRCQRRSCRH
jgi:DNA-directed RNA polymerase specialized sigma24 family protein